MIKNYTTSVAEEKTVGEIMSLLAAKGARSIRIDYDERNRPNSVSFVIAIKTGSNSEVPVPFSLPCNFDGVFKALLRGRRTYRSRSDFERNPESKNHARRVAWRIVKDWVQAQMALIEADCAQLAQVFLPYAVMEETQGGGITMFDRFLAQATSQKQLGGGA